MQNKICLVTGGTSGIGRQTALGLANQNFSVIIIGRDLEKCEQTVNYVMRKSGNKSIDYLVADLSEPEQIDQLVFNFKQKYNSLHVLINNAGARFMERQENSAGIEMTLALNYLAYFYLTNQLLDVLIKSAPSRIINVTSGSRTKAIDFEDIEGKESYDGRKAYAQSKLATVMFTYEMAKRLKGQEVTVNAVDPGGVATNFNRNNGLKYWLRHLTAHIVSRNLKSPAKGATANIYLAASPDIQEISGKLFKNDKTFSSSDLVFDDRDTERLWQVSEELLKKTVGRHSCRPDLFKQDV